MSGIAGIYNLGGAAVSSGDVGRMVGSMKRRGPDESGVWSEGAVGLGQCMLWTTPESLHEQLPFTNMDWGLTITADARIDNRADLISSLGLKKGASDEISDSELILASYEKWGEACPTQLIGDFAFAIWDRRRQVLFCARDHFGVRPFNYYRSDQLFVLASEIKALLSLSAVPKRINEARIADYLVDELEGIDQTCTFYNGVLRLPPGHSLTIGPNGMSLRCYWSLDQTREVLFRSDSEYAEAFLDTFTEAVRCRLRSVFPVGSMLSGGLDSSSIVAVAREIMLKNGTGRLHTFSAVSKSDLNCVETHFINSVLGQGGIEPHTVQPDQLGPYLQELRDVLTQKDDLFDNLILLPQIMYVAARQTGLRVLLDGVDGDTVVSQGIDYLSFLLRKGMWRTAIREARGISQFYYRFNYKPSSLLLQNGYSVLKSHLPSSVRRLRKTLRRKSRLDEITRNTIISQDFARRVDLPARLETLNRSINPSPRKTLREAHLANLRSPYITVALERYGRVAARYSIEPRHPFFDKRLVDFCLALPWDQKVNGGWTKIVLRRAMKGLLQDEVCWRRGWENLGPDFTSSWMAHERTFIDEVLKNSLDNIGDYVNIFVVREAHQRYLSGGDSEVDRYKVQQAMVVALWLQSDQACVATKGLMN